MFFKKSPGKILKAHGFSSKCTQKRSTVITSYSQYSVHSCLICLIYYNLYLPAEFIQVYFICYMNLIFTISPVTLSWPTILFFHKRLKALMRFCLIPISYTCHIILAFK